MKADRAGCSGNGCRMDYHVNATGRKRRKHKIKIRISFLSEKVKRT